MNAHRPHLLNQTQIKNLTGLPGRTIRHRIKLRSFPPPCTVLETGQPLWDRETVERWCGVGQLFGNSE